MPRKNISKYCQELIILAAIYGAFWIIISASDNVIFVHFRTAQDDMFAIKGQLDMYRSTWGYYPPENVGLSVIAEGLRQTPTVPDGEELEHPNYPKDPWGHDYVYKFPGQHGVYDIWSPGKDDIAGTDDDIQSWNEDGSQPRDVGCKRTSYFSPLRLLFAGLFWMCAIGAFILWVYNKKSGKGRNIT